MIKSLMDDRPIQKILFKFPMEQRVVTEDGEVWDYFIIHERVVWRYVCTTFFEGKSRNKPSRPLIP